MNQSPTIMTKRTFGLFSAIAAISVGAFASYLVLADPNPGDSTKFGASNTAQIDTARSVANTSVPKKTADTQAPTSRQDTATVVPPRVAQQPTNTATRRPAASSQSQPSRVAPIRPAVEPSAPRQQPVPMPQPVLPAALPVAQTPQTTQNTQSLITPPVMDFVEKAIDTLLAPSFNRET